MIVKDNTSYLWSSAMPQGIKMSFDAMSGQGAPQQGASQGLDLNAADFITPALPGRRRQPI
jgi:hypothetical protein